MSSGDELLQLCTGKAPAGNSLVPSGVRSAKHARYHMNERLISGSDEDTEVISGQRLAGASSEPDAGKNRISSKNDVSAVVDQAIK